MDTLVPIPTRGRTVTRRRRVRLSDMDPLSRVRLDAVVRYLQDVAIDDVEETGWGVPEHLWFIRRIRIDVVTPFLGDREVELVTWCSGLAAIAAGRRWSLRGDRGGEIEVDSVWIHLGPDGRPERIGDEFSVYAEATNGRLVSTRLDLHAPPLGALRTAWPLRAADVDLHGHVNNAAYWQAVEDRLRLGRLDPRRPLRARLDYRAPIDLGDEVELVEHAEGDRFTVAFAVRDEVRAVSHLEALT